MNEQIFIVKMQMIDQIDENFVVDFGLRRQRRSHDTRINFFQMASMLTRRFTGRVAFGLGLGHCLKRQLERSQQSSVMRRRFGNSCPVKGYDIAFALAENMRVIIFYLPRIFQHLDKTLLYTK